MHRLAAFTLGCLLAAAGAATAQTPPPAGPLTRPEKTSFNETSHYDDVVAFMDAVARSAPKLIHLTSFGKTVEGRSLPLAVVGAPDATPDAVRGTGKLRVYIQGNIHAGEVEGKESAQMLLRDLAAGRHADWLQSMVLIIAPIYNADGNEKFALTNRGRQHGPMAGQGQRPNAQGLDLNRDHMKLESPEARAFVKLMTDYDPHVSMDLHTTNGTRHAYYLTYSPPLNPATYPGIVQLLRSDWLPAVTRTIKSKYGWDYYYYGNLEGRGAAGTPDERAWRTFDSRPRFNNNYIGLRNRFAILSEAYAYATFEDRIKATSRFVEETLNYARAHAARIRAITEAADRLRLAGSRLPLRAELERSAPDVEILMGEIVEEKNPNDGHLMDRRADVKKPERMPEYGTFKGTESERVPSTYYIPATLTAVVEHLQAHGVKTTTLGRPVAAPVEEFQIAGNETAREFQGHKERTLKGGWGAATRDLPAGTVRVDTAQPLGRLAFYLLEPRSDDGLVDWNIMDDALAGATVFPIVRSRN